MTDRIWLTFIFVCVHAMHCAWPNPTIIVIIAHHENAISFWQTPGKIEFESRERAAGLGTQYTNFRR